MKVVFSALLIALLSLAPGLAQAAENVVGLVLAVEGEAKIANTTGQIVDAQVNSKVHPNDVLSTGPDSKLYIQFIDHTEFTLSENAQFTVDEYNFNETDKSKNYATYSVLQGAFLYVSGLVAKRDNPDVRVNIPQGSIGIRGTKFWGGNIDGAYSVIVGEGKVTVKNDVGFATLIKGQGTTIKDRITKPEAPKKWAPAKIAQATATVTLKDPAEIGKRMEEARANEEALRVQHEAAQKDVKRIDTDTLEKQVEQRMIQLHPEVRPDLLKPAEVPAADAAASTDTTADTTKETTKERVKTLADTLKEQQVVVPADEPKPAVITTLKETVKPALSVTTTTKQVTQDAAAANVDTRATAGTSATTTVIKNTTDTATDAGTRAVTTTTAVTKDVTDSATGAVSTTTKAVQDTVETPVKNVIDSVTPEKTTEPASQPVDKTSDIPATDAVKDTLATVGKTVDGVAKTTTSTIEKTTGTAGSTANTISRTLAQPLNLGGDKKQ